MTLILITGGAGYVGSHCTKALAAAGHNSVVLDNLLFGHREFVRWELLIEGDIRDASALDAVFSDIGLMPSCISRHSLMLVNRSARPADIMTSM